MDQRSTIFIVRVVACVVIVAALGAFIGELKSTPDLTGIALLTPLAVLAFGGGIGAILFGIGAVLKEQQKPVEASPLDLAQRQLIDLALKVEDLGASINRLASQREGAMAAPSHMLPADVPAVGTPDVLKVMQSMIEELRDLSLLPDEQRQKQWKDLQQQRKQLGIQSAAALISGRRWTDAEKAIVEIEKQWPADPVALAIRTELKAARNTAENEAFGLAESQIESEMSMSHWERSAELARKLASDFPTHARAAELLNRVEREKGIYTETTAGRLYDEIRHNVERRIWRRALVHAQKLLETFPTHPRTELVRKQIHTIQDNAEIQERQEQELRIGELIRARRFDEAVKVSQDLLGAYPASPQAEAIQKLLPRIQQLAAEDGSDSAQHTAD